MKILMLLEKLAWVTIIVFAICLFPLCYWAATPDELVIISEDDNELGMRNEELGVKVDFTVAKSPFKPQPQSAESSTGSDVAVTASMAYEESPCDSHNEEDIVCANVGCNINDKDIELMARCVWLEARGECYEGQVAVAEVVLNRVSSTSFPDTVEGVIYEQGQFSCVGYINTATPTQTQYDAVFDAIEGNGALNNENCVFFSVGSCCGTYYTTIGNHVFGVEG